MGNCQVSVPIQPEREANLTSCFGSLKPIDYNLRNFVVTISSSETNQVIFSELIFNTTQGLGRVNVTYDTRTLKLFVSSTSNLPRGVKTLTTELKDNPRLSVLVTFPSSGTNALLFEFSYSRATSGTITAEGEEIGKFFSVPLSDSIPNLTVTVVATPDGKQICELLFRVTTENKIADYKQYCVPLASVICARGSTLRDKILALEQGNAFLEYAVVRYILSGLLGNGCFSVNTLRQRYTESFLKAVKYSQYKDFLPILEANPQFATYFKC